MTWLRGMAMAICVVAGLFSCDAPESGSGGKATFQASGEVLLESVGPEATKPVPPAVDGFDFPVGPPDAKGYYDAQPFQENRHLGSDWNGTGGGNSDLGDPVYAMANGLVMVAQDFEYGWGNVVRVWHNVGTETEPELIESLYAHLDSIMVAVGDTLARGQQLGTIGNADGIYLAHLHFEVRDSVGMPLGGGYSDETKGFLDPTVFIREMRGDGRNN